MNVLGISCYYHDAAAALVQDGLVTAACEEERLSRVKHDPRFPEHAIRFCLQEGGIAAADLDWVVFYEKPFNKFERVLSNCLGGAPRTWDIFQESSLAWLKEKFWVRDHICHRLGVPAGKVLFVDHHLSHASSAFFCSGFREAAVLTVDGVGEWATAAMGTARADWEGGGCNAVHLTHELRFPHSLGLLYSVFTAFLGFEVNEGEYKVMGMAAYGQPRYLDRIHQIAHLAADGSLRLDLRYFRFHESARNSFSVRFVDLFGRPRDAGEPFAITAEQNAQVAAEQLRRCQYHADIAASIQAFAEEALLRMAKHLRDVSGQEALCLAGGVALNSVANARIAREAGFKEVFVQPAAGDSGGALGAALYAYHVLLGRPRRYIMEHAFLGVGESESSIADFVREQGAAYVEYDDIDRLAAEVAAEIAGGKVVGWFQGRSEWGARALGNRSILADPRRAEMKDLVNRKIKFREPFRPFAPVVPEGCAPELFACTPSVLQQPPARFMLYVLPWQRERGESVPAVNHCGTGRLQTLRPEWNPRYYAVLDHFHQRTGTPVLLNTSFNLRGEPIVCTAKDAWKTFHGSGLDLVVLDRFLVRK